jgi:hypothetical protein
MAYLPIYNPESVTERVIVAMDLPFINKISHVKSIEDDRISDLYIIQAIIRPLLVRPKDVLFIPLSC